MIRENQDGKGWGWSEFFSGAFAGASLIFVAFASGGIKSVREPEQKTPATVELRSFVSVASCTCGVTGSVATVSCRGFGATDLSLDVQNGAVSLDLHQGGRFTRLLAPAGDRPKLVFSEIRP